MHLAAEQLWACQAVRHALDSFHHSTDPGFSSNRAGQDDELRHSSMYLPLSGVGLCVCVCVCVWVCVCV